MTTKFSMRRFMHIMKPVKVFNMKKAALSVMIASWLQIVVAIFLSIQYFLGYTTSTFYLMLSLIPIVVIGNALLMYNAWKILSSGERNEQILQALDTENQTIEKMRAQRHDFMNHLQVVYSLLQLKEFEESEDYLKKIYQDLKEVGNLMRTSNQAVNALLSAKNQQAEQNHVLIIYEIETQLNIMPMDDWMFCRILGNMLDNAIYAAKDDDTPLVKLSMSEDINGLNIVISNNGAKIAPEHISEVFKPGFTTKGDNGTGMGLYIVSGLLADLGGSISLSTENLTSFSLYLPY